MRKNELKLFMNPIFELSWPERSRGDRRVRGMVENGSVWLVRLGHKSAPSNSQAASGPSQRKITGQKGNPVFSGTIGPTRQQPGQ